MVCARSRAVQLGLGEGETEAHTLCKTSSTPTAASQVLLGETEERGGKARWRSETQTQRYTSSPKLLLINISRAPT